MPDDAVICPKCGERISLNAAVTASIEARLRKKLLAEAEERDRELSLREQHLKASEKKVEDRVTELVSERLAEQTPKLKERIKREIAEESRGELEELRNRLSAKEERLKALEKRERDLVTREEELAGREQQISLDAKKAVEKERETLEKRLRRDFQVQSQGELDDLRNRLQVKEERVKTLEKRERLLLTKEEELNGREQQVALDAKKAVEKERAALEERLRQEIQTDSQAEIDELRNRLQAKDERAKAMEKRERELAAKDEEVQERERRVGIEAKRALDQERDSLVAKIKGEESERWEQLLRERQAELDRVNQALERAQKASVSGELAGEVAERTLVDRLSDAFDDDQVLPTGRGKAGGDVLQSVDGGGLILWESKDRYENWSNEWIPKLKRDRDEAKASVGVLVTSVGPGSKPIRTPSFEDGIVLSPPGMVVGVASLLRPMLGEIARQRRLYDKQESLQETVYAWVTSTAFKNGISAIAENLHTLKHEVSRAKVNHARWYARMEVGVDRTARAVGEFWGSAQGQARLPDLPALGPEGGFVAQPKLEDGVGARTDPDDESDP